MVKNLPSPSSHVDEKNVFTFDKLVTKKAADKIDMMDTKKYKVPK